MKDLLKHLIYEHAINVFFHHVKENLFSGFNLKDFKEQYEQNAEYGSKYKMLTFSMNGYIYQFHTVNVVRLNSNFIHFEFQSALVFNSIDDSTDVEMWDSDESPVAMDLDNLVETM